MRIGILTFHRAYNCGAMLQAWALKRVLEQMGHQVEFPCCNGVGETTRWRQPWTNPGKQGLNWMRSFIGRSLINLGSIPAEDVRIYRYKRFRRNHLQERVCYPGDLEKFYDAVVIGSDQVWCERVCGESAPLFFAENLSPSLCKIAYAASCGDAPLRGANMQRVVDAVNRMRAVSVREHSAKEQISSLAQNPVAETVDPTLLLRPEQYDAIDTKCGENEPYLFMYALSTTPFLVKTARELARRLGVRCIIAPCYQYSRWGAPRGLSYSVSPDRLVGYIRHAKYVLAESFHGTALGVLFNKSVLSLRQQIDKFGSRPAALLKFVGCENRLVTPDVSLDEMERMLKMPLPTTVGERLCQARETSLKWLEGALNA